MEGRRARRFSTPLEPPGWLKRCNQAIRAGLEEVPFWVEDGGSCRLPPLPRHQGGPARTTSPSRSGRGDDWSPTLASGARRGAKIFDPLWIYQEAQPLNPSHSSPARRCPFWGRRSRVVQTTSPFHGPKGANGTRNLIDGQGFRAVKPDRSADPVSGGTKGAKIFGPFGASEVAQALYPSHSSRARRSPFLGSKMEGRARVERLVRSPGGRGVADLVWVGQR